MSMANGIMVLSLLWSLLAIPAIAMVNSGDKAALLAFKSQVSNGGSLASWNSSTNFCSWEGVTCSHRRPKLQPAAGIGTRRLLFCRTVTCFHYKPIMQLNFFLFLRKSIPAI
jgi:hypothetical protein